MLNTKAINIVWDTDGEDVDLPTSVDIPDAIAVDYFDGVEDIVTDYLSDTYGWCVSSLEVVRG